MLNSLKILFYDLPRRFIFVYLSRKVFPPICQLFERIYLWSIVNEFNVYKSEIREHGFTFGSLPAKSIFKYIISMPSDELKKENSSKSFMTTFINLDLEIANNGEKIEGDTMEKTNVKKPNLKKVAEIKATKAVAKKAVKKTVAKKVVAKKTTTKKVVAKKAIAKKK